MAAEAMVEREEEQEDGAVAGVVVPSNNTTIQLTTHPLGDITRVREDPPSTKITANGRWGILFFMKNIKISIEQPPQTAICTYVNLVRGKWPVGVGVIVTF